MRLHTIGLNGSIRFGIGARRHNLQKYSLDTILNGTPCYPQRQWQLGWIDANGFCYLFIRAQNRVAQHTIQVLRKREVSLLQRPVIPPHRSMGQTRQPRLLRKCWKAYVGKDLSKLLLQRLQGRKPVPDPPLASTEVNHTEAVLHMIFHEGMACRKDTIGSTQGRFLASTHSTSIYSTLHHCIDNNGGLLPSGV